jgi:hypothetical protein
LNIPALFIHTLCHKKVQDFTLSNNINPDTWIVLFGFDTPTHNLHHEYTNPLLAPNDVHPLLYCICVFDHAGFVLHHHDKSVPQLHPVLVAFAICHEEQLIVAVANVFIFIPTLLYRLDNIFPVPLVIHVYVLFQLLAHERLIYHDTALVPLTYKVSLFVLLSKFIPVV